MADDYTCDECGKTFDSQRGLSVHEAQVHDDEDNGADDSETDMGDSEAYDAIDSHHAPGTGTQSSRSMLPAFGVGVIVGILLAAGTVAAVGDLPATTGQVDAATAADQFSSFVADNQEQLLPGDMDMSVESADPVAGAPLYNLSVALTVQNQSTADRFPVFVTADGRYAFFQPPIDLTRPLAEQQ